MKNTLCDINSEIRENLTRFINDTEDKYHQQIFNIAEFMANHNEKKIVMLAGPSGSGKTTTAHILRGYLKELGVHTEVISLDDFYLPYEKLPRLPSGKPDIESVYALDLKELRRCFGELINNGKTFVPKFDFHTKEKIVNARTIDISSSGVVVVEGLHALNPEITAHLPHENLFKIYISVNQSITENGEKLLSSRQIRLMRRVLRDEIFRNSTISQTLKLWTDVVNGEEKYLYCFKDTADVKLVTLHAYEPGVYKERFLRLAAGMDSQCDNYEYAMRTALAVEKFESIDASHIPADSLIREFIGGGKYA